MKNFLNLRIFWTCTLGQGADGYYYYYWNNWANNRYDTIFAGYSKRGLNKKSTSWKTVKERLNEN